MTNIGVIMTIYGTIKVKLHSKIAIKANISEISVIQQKA